MTTEAKVWDGTQWRTGIRIYDGGSIYPNRPAGWVDLADAVTAPAQWTFDSDAQGWLDNTVQGNPLEWSPTDGRVLGTTSLVPSFFNGYSHAYSPYFKLLGRGPFKVRGTVAAGIVSGHVEPTDSKTMTVRLMQSGWMSDSVLAEAADSTLTGSWITLESGLWTPPPELNMNTASFCVAAEISYGTGLFPPYGDATWRVHVNDATVLHADGSIAQRIITPPHIGRAWNGSAWVDFI